MTRMIRAELIKMTRRQVLVAMPIAATVFAVISALAVYLSALPAGAPAEGRAVTLGVLARAGGATRAFAVGASFVGFLVFVTFIANVAHEFSGGTFRALLIEQPRRVRLLAGKMVGLLLFAAGVVLLGEALSVVASLFMAGAKDVPTAAWFTGAGLRHALTDYANVMAVVTGWALLGMTLGVVVRSTPLALGIGIAWAGPFEHILRNAWDTASRWFPGLVMEALAAGGTVDVSLVRASVLTTLYVGTAAVVAFTLFARRDLTS